MKRWLWTRTVESWLVFFAFGIALDAILRPPLWGMFLVGFFSAMIVPDDLRRRS